MRLLKLLTLALFVAGGMMFASADSASAHPRKWTCTAKAFTWGGHHIRYTRGKATRVHKRAACRKARQRCRRKLRHRGLRWAGRCVVTKAVRRRHYH